MGMFGYENKTHWTQLHWTRSETKTIMFLYIIGEKDVSEVTQAKREILEEGL